MARWAGRAPEFGPGRPQPGGDRLAPRPPVRFDPLTHPVAITGRSVIGDDLRIPVTWCDMEGCGAAFSDPAAIGEADNRARAVFAGWSKDALDRLVCTDCRQRYPAAPVWWVLPQDPGAIVDHRVANGSARPAGGVGLPARLPEGDPGRPAWLPAASLPPPAPGQGRHQRGTQRPRLLAALASGRNGQAAPGQFARP
jgi:hypothetical protein